MTRGLKTEFFGGGEMRCEFVAASWTRGELDRLHKSAPAEIFAPEGRRATRLAKPQEKEGGLRLRRGALFLAPGTMFCVMPMKRQPTNAAIKGTWPRDCAVQVTSRGLRPSTVRRGRD